jgi:flagellar biosynthesis protein FliQ
VSRLRALYGTTPLHLVAIVASLAIAGYAAAKIVEGTTNWPKIALWFVAAVLLHDFVLFPLYTLLDRIAGGRRPGPGVNFVRVPALLSALLLLVSLPLVLSIAPETYAGASGLEPEPYLERWLAITGVLFAASGLLYALRARRGAGRDGPRPRVGSA